MPEVRLEVTGAAELAEMLQFLSQWLARDPACLGASLEDFVGHPAYNTQQLRKDLDPLSSCSAAATVSPCSGSRRHDAARLPGQPRIRRALRASTSFVLAAARLRALIPLPSW
jgi:hypothetical protein